MATYSSSSGSSHTSNATFSAWARLLSGILTSAGFIKTSDTGQVDWTSDQVIPSSGVFPFYEIRRFNDSLQSSSPLYMKIEYGTGTASASYKAIRLTFGTLSSNGSGALTGGLTPPIEIASAAGSATSTACYASGADGRFSFIGWPNAGDSAMLCFSISRTVSSNGAMNGDGFNFIYSASGAAIRGQMYIPRETLGGSRSAHLQFFACHPTVGTGAYAGNIGIYPIFPNVGYPGYPCGDGVLAFITDIGASGSLIDVPMYGQTINFMAALSSSSVNGVRFLNNGAANYMCVAYRYD